MYEFQYLFEARSNGGISHHKFFIDNVEVTHARTNLAHDIVHLLTDNFCKLTSG